MLPLLTFLGDKFRWLGKDTRGATTVYAVEYAVVLALVALAVALFAPGLPEAVIEIFEDTWTALLGKVKKDFGMYFGLF